MHDRTMHGTGGKPSRGIDFPESSSSAEEVGEEEGGHVKALVEVSVEAFVVCRSLLIGL